MTPRLGILGASGRLGRRLVALASEHGLPVVAALTRPGGSAIGIDAGTLSGVAPLGVPVVAATPEAVVDLDVLLDVSQPGVLDAVVAGLGPSAAVVSGVTGLRPDEEDALAALARTRPVLHATNFSLGVAVLAELVGRASAALPDHDVEIVEVHHRRKVDAPSGTAWTLASEVAAARGVDLRSAVRHGREGRPGPRASTEIGMHAVRGGDVVGEHTVWLAGDGERLLLGHVASSRDTFAHGALRAAAWISGRPAGRYAMRDVLGLDASGPSSGGRGASAASRAD